MNGYVIAGLAVLGLWYLVRARRNSPSAGRFTTFEARTIGEAIGIDWPTAAFPVEQFRRGLAVELEHGASDPETDVTGDDLMATGKIAWAHLNELPDYYTRLARMER